MRRRLHNALRHSSEMRALFVLIIVVILRTWRRIPTLRPHRMIMPAALLQVVVFLLAAFTPEQFVLKFAAGNFIIAAALMLPLTLRPAEVRVHWVRSQE